MLTNPFRSLNVSGGSYDYLPIVIHFSFIKISFQPVGTMGELDSIQAAVLGLKHSAMVANEVWELYKGVNPCDSVPPPINLACHGSYTISGWIVYGVRTAIVLAHDILCSIFESKTDAPSRVFDLNLRIEAMFNNFQVFDSWSTAALETINKNMITQHTEMREQLQDRHEIMENKIGELIEQLSTSLSTQHKMLNTTLQVRF